MPLVNTQPMPVATVQLDLAEIEASLRAVQQAFPRINATLDTPRDPLADTVIETLLAGYEYLNALLATDQNPLAPGYSRHLLQLNQLVVCGSSEWGWEDCERHTAENEQRFYDDRNIGGVRAFMNWLADNPNGNVWRRAAGAYIQMLTAPQLFIEGNHRTGALVISYLLARTGRPPFVLTEANAKAWFDPSSLVKGCRKRTLGGCLALPRLRRRLADLMEASADERFLRR